MYIFRKCEYIKCVHKIKYSSIAQSVERMTVNHDVAGSSPAGGAKNRVTPYGVTLFFILPS